ncbi:MAG: winged helix-turn-helix domain-containing protein [Bryobacteraceae bacterium]
MPLPASPPPVRHRIVQFGPYEFHVGTQELRKHGIRLKLQGKPLQLLAALIENPGELIMRADLEKRLWPTGTFVDFDNGLNTAAKRLRAALSDSAENPLYIETLARSGYRFIAPIHYLNPVQMEREIRPPVHSPRQYGWIAFVALLAAGAGAGAWLYFSAASSAHPIYRQLTFRRGPVFSARFAPGGQSVIFGAQFERGPRQVYMNNGVSPESRSLGHPGSSVFSVSRQGELALNEHLGTVPISGGNLSRVPANGGIPVPVERSVMSADWAPDGRQLAIVRMTAGRSKLEYPPGTVLYETAGWISSVRFHPNGEFIAFIDHPARHDDAGTVRLASLSGEIRALTENWLSTAGLAWHPNGELWFSATRDLAPPSLWSVNTATTKLRSVATFPGVVSLRDISPEGDVLLTRDTKRLESIANFGDGEFDISWQDWTRAVDVFSDGRVLFDETGVATGSRAVTFVHSRSGTARLAEDQLALAFSPDGLFALTLPHDNRRQLRLYPFTGGAIRALPQFGVTVQWAKFFPDGKHLLALAAEKDKPLRLYRLGINGGEPEPISGPGMVRHAAISPDGRRVLYLAADGKLMCWSSTGVVEVPAKEPLAPIQWRQDDATVYVQHVKGSGIPAKVSLIDVGSGHLTFWKWLGPVDPVGVDQLTRVLISTDEKAYVFSARRVQSELFLVPGFH